MQSIGETLRQARHDRKITLEDVSRATKIKIDTLERLEADDFTSLAAPMYTKGFLKLYAEQLGLDSQPLVDAYLKSQGGLRRQGLHLETDATVRAKKDRELQLPMAGVIRVVVALTAVVVVVLLGHHLWVRWSSRSAKPAAPVRAAAAPAASTATLPKADFDAVYQLKNKPSAELTEQTVR
jgi:cytoskeletal protein RodZ